MFLVTLFMFTSCSGLVNGDEEAATLLQRRRPGSCEDLIVTVDQMKNQVTSTNLYVQEIRTRMERLEQGQEKMEKYFEEKISELADTVSEILDSCKRTSGELIPAVKVEQSSTYPGYPVGPEKAIDGNLETESHTTCTLPRQWFRYHFSERQAIGQIKVVNGKINEYKDRFNGLRVSVMLDNLNRLPCRVDTVEVREGDNLEAQTYYLDCTDNTGVGVEFVLDTGTCLEFRQIEVYAP